MADLVGKDDEDDEVVWEQKKLVLGYALHRHRLGGGQRGCVTHVGPNQSKEAHR